MSSASENGPSGREMDAIVPNFFDEDMMPGRDKWANGVEMLHSAVVHAPDQVEELVFVFDLKDFLEGDPSPLLRAVEMNRARFVSVVVDHYCIPAWRLAFMMKEASSPEMVEALMEARDIHRGYDLFGLIRDWAMQGKADLALACVNRMSSVGARHRIEEWPFHAELMWEILHLWERKDIHELVMRIMVQIDNNPDHDRSLLVLCLKYINLKGGYKVTMPHTQRHVICYPQPNEVVDQVFSDALALLEPHFVCEIIYQCHRDNLPRALRCRLFTGYHSSPGHFERIVNNSPRVINFIFAMPMLYQSPEICDFIEKAYTTQLMNKYSIWSEKKMCMVALYLNDPHEARRQAESYLGLVDKSANALALTVYLSDNHLTVSQREQGERANKTKRFFNIAMRLPLDIQHVLCSVVGPYPKDQISHNDLEKALIQNARHYAQKEAS